MPNHNVYGIIKLLLVLQAWKGPVLVIAAAIMVTKPYATQMQTLIFVHGMVRNANNVMVIRQLTCL